jgi:nitrate reductase NapAB chaperone NapD
MMLGMTSGLMLTRIKRNNSSYRCNDVVVNGKQKRKGRDIMSRINELLDELYNCIESGEIVIIFETGHQDRLNRLKTIYKSGNEEECINSFER